LGDKVVIAQDAAFSTEPLVETGAGAQWIHEATRYPDDTGFLGIVFAGLQLAGADFGKAITRTGFQLEKGSVVAVGQASLPRPKAITDGGSELVAVTAETIVNTGQSAEQITAIIQKLIVAFGRGSVTFRSGFVPVVGREGFQVIGVAPLGQVLGSVQPAFQAFFFRIAAGEQKSEFDGG